jgi:hypothetical protein
LAWYVDLAQCKYFGSDPNLLAVGWLENGRPFETGPVDPAFRDRLIELLRHPWARVALAGAHTCDLCRGARHSLNLFVPGQGVAYAAPALILHYIDVHGYRPPNEFCDAVVACPEMGSEEYLAALRQVAPSLFGFPARLS